ncbi:unnamed protein product, partial [Rotaria sp. Silwood1]
TLNQRIISSRNNQRARTDDVPLASIRTNATRANGNHTHYTIARHAAYVTYEEPPPPSYEAFMSSVSTPSYENSEWF